MNCNICIVLNTLIIIKYAKYFIIQYIKYAYKYDYNHIYIIMIYCMINYITITMIVDIISLFIL